MTKAQEILILGGGVGGQVVANRLRKALPPEHRIRIVDRDPAFTFAPSFLWVMTGARETAAITRQRERLVARGVEVIVGELEAVDPGARSARVAGRTLHADEIVVALGADLDLDAVPGLRAGGHTFYTPEGADALRQAFAQFQGGRIVLVTAAPGYKCPAAPYEAAMLLEAACRSRGIRHLTEIALYTAEPGPMGVAGPEVSAAVRQMVQAKGIAYHPEHRVVEVRPEERRLRFDNDSETGFDLLAYVPPHKAPRAVVEAGLAPAGGWVAVDRETLATTYPHVHAIGDVTGIPLRLGKPLPKAGVFAHGQAEVVAANIAHRITGRGRPMRYDGEGSCFIETGDGRAGFGKGNFYAEPVPRVKLYRPGWYWHAAKVLFERRWLRNRS